MAKVELLSLKGSAAVETVVKMSRWPRLGELAAMPRDGVQKEATASLRPAVPKGRPAPHGALGRDLKTKTPGPRNSRFSKAPRWWPGLEKPNLICISAENYYLWSSIWLDNYQQLWPFLLTWNPVNETKLYRICFCTDEEENESCYWKLPWMVLPASLEVFVPKEMLCWEAQLSKEKLCIHFTFWMLLLHLKWHDLRNEWNSRSFSK